MTSFNMFVTTLVTAVSILSSHLNMTTEATPTFNNHICPNTTTFNPNGPYKSNLDIVLSKLSSNAAQESDYIYFSADAGGVNGTSNYVYGIYLCRGDVTSAICHDCVLTSIEYARQKCPVEKEVIIWYDECMLRYSNQSFQSTMSVSPSVAMVNVREASNKDEFRLEVEKTMNEFASEAANGAKKFMVQEANISGFDTIYSLVQCTQDLSSQDCTKCLQTAISRLPFCCDGSRGARVLFPSCSVRYELYQFYYVSAPPQTTPQLVSHPPPADPVAQTKGKSKMSPLTIFGIVIAVTTVSLALLVTGCLMLLRHKRARDKHYTVQPQNVRTSSGCNCNSACVPNDPSCSCIQKSGGDFPFTANGILVSRKPLIHECGPSCRCFPNCKNRVSQSGVKIRVEVFKTKDRGWGLRSLDPIRAGSFICEYAGEVIDKFKLMQNREEIENNEYVFDTSSVYDSFKWNYEPALLGEESSNNANEDYIIPSPLVISSKNVGNVARFINHSCSPNIFWQPIL